MLYILESLLRRISEIDGVRAIGISGEMVFPEPGEGDIDVFIYCDKIASAAARQAITSDADGACSGFRSCVFEGGIWGTGDYLLINGVETWLMYFTEKETIDYIDSVLQGEYPDKQDNYFYPTGRCAMLKNINIIYEENGFLSSMKNKLSAYPDSLAKKLLRYHTEALEDNEDLRRAVARKDVLFYHFALDIALDHYLQALFALNKTYFPSRKRSLQFIKTFYKKPEKCEERLVKALESSGRPDGLHDSYAVWETIVSDFLKIADIDCT